MLPRHRLIFSALAFTLIAFTFFQFQYRSASADITGISVSPNPVTNPDTATITIAADETTEGDPIRVQVEAGTIVAAICISPVTGSETCATTMTPTSGGATVTVTASDDDGDPNEPITLFLAWTPPTVSRNTDVDIFTCQGGGDPCPFPNTPNTTVRVEPSTSGTPTRVATITYGVEITASPTVLPCGGGMTELEARAVNVEGGFTVRGLKFQFYASNGDLIQTSNDTAVLSLKPGMGTTATVYARAGDGQSQSITITSACGNIASVVLTASPNVVQCGGKSKLTATARDSSGHIVEGVGFHFATNSGLLEVGPPNTAAGIDGEAFLTMYPQQGETVGGQPNTLSATVVVSVGGTLGTAELSATDEVTVQQFCPSYASAPSLIALTSSRSKISCGGSTFIGALLRDVSGNPLPDGVPITFLTDTGRLVAPSAEGGRGAGATGNGTADAASTPAVQTAQSPREVTVLPRGGTANVVYIADAVTSGTAHITAGGGASFGSIDIQIDCTQQLGLPGGAPGSVVAGVTGGVRISPPSTGDGGVTDE